MEMKTPIANTGFVVQTGCFYSSVILVDSFDFK